MTLTGNRNQCGGCGQYFNSNFAFGKHRTGDYGINRRCLNVEEIEAKKMEKNAAGFWVSRLMTESEKERSHAIRQQKTSLRQGI